MYVTTEIRFFALKSKEEKILDRGQKRVFKCGDNNNNVIFVLYDISLTCNTNIQQQSRPVLDIAVVKGVHRPTFGNVIT